MKSLPPKQNIFNFMCVQDNWASEHNVRGRSSTEHSNAACLLIIFSTIIRTGGMHRIPSSTRWMLIYKFACSCGAEHNGCKTHYLGKRIKEQHSARLEKGRQNQSLDIKWTQVTLQSKLMLTVFFTIHQTDFWTLNKTLYAQGEKASTNLPIPGEQNTFDKQSDILANASRSTA